MSVKYLNETGRLTDWDPFILFVIRFAVSGGQRQDVSPHKKHTADNTKAGLNTTSEASKFQSESFTDIRAREATCTLLSSNLWSEQQMRLRRLCGRCLRSQLDEFLMGTQVFCNDPSNVVNKHLLQRHITEWKQDI